MTAEDHNCGAATATPSSTATTGRESALSWALRYAALDWPVFPIHWFKEGRCSCENAGCKRQGKHPLTEHGFKDATCDEEQIRRWWCRWPNAQIAIATEKAGLCVIDLDLKPAENKNGLELWDRLRDDHGRDDCGLIAKSESGGRHLFYLLPDERIPPRDNISPGLDVRAHSAYVIVPSPTSPRREWLVGDPFEINRDGATDLGAMPDWVFQIVRRQDREPSVAAVAPLSGGQLSELLRAEILSALYSIPPSVTRAVWLQVIFATHAAFEGALEGAQYVEEWSAKTKKPGQYETDEATSIYRDAKLPWSQPGAGAQLVDKGTLFALAAQRGWRWSSNTESHAATSPVHAASESEVEPEPPASPFPVRLIGGDDLLSRTVQWIVDSALLPQPALALGNAIPMLGAIVGRRVEGSTGVRTNFLTIGISGTASGKEHPQKRTVDLLEAAGLECFLGGGWKSGSAIVSSLHSRPSQFVNLDEFGRILLAQAGKHAPPHVLDIRKVLLEVSGRADGVYFGDCYANAKENPQRKIREPNLCYYGATVPGSFFKALESDALTDGFLNRHLTFFTDEDTPKPQFRNQQCRWTKEEIVASLHELELATRTSDLQVRAGLPDVATNCRRIPFADGGARWESILTDNQARIRAMRAKQERCADLWGRFPEHVARLALLKAISRNPRAETVTDDDLTWAIELATWCHERMALAATRHIADNDTERGTLRVLRIIEEAGHAGISQWQLTRRLFWLKARERDDIVKMLIDAREIHAREQVSTRADGRGRTKVTYYAGPAPEEREA